MIFKTLLKYKIFEYCLEALFEKVKVNFSVCKIQRHRVGDQFRRIDYYKDGRLWRSHHNCTILDVSDYMVSFDFTSTYIHSTNNSYSGHAITAYGLEFLDFIK